MEHDMEAIQDAAATDKTPNNTRRFTSPNRVLARSFRLARDKWKQKCLDAKLKLKRARQLAEERGASRDQWRAECEVALEQARAAEGLAQKRLLELEQCLAREQERAEAAKKNNPLAHAS
jgi:hypothetical protein